MEVRIKEQNKFPYLEDFKNRFPIDQNTIFVFEETIYTNNELPDDIMVHEIAHLHQQKKHGAVNWITKYLTDETFRLEQEIQAYRVQLQAIKQTGDRQMLFNVTDECANNLSSKLYGKLLNKRQALEVLRIN